MCCFLAPVGVGNLEAFASVRLGYGRRSHMAERWHGADQRYRHGSRASQLELEGHSSGDPFGLSGAESSFLENLFLVYLQSAAPWHRFAGSASLKTLSSGDSPCKARRRRVRWCRGKELPGLVAHCNWQVPLDTET